MLKYILVCAIGMIVGSLIRGAVEKQRDWIHTEFFSKDAEYFDFDLSGRHVYKNVYFVPAGPHEAKIIASSETQVLDSTEEFNTNGD